MNIALVFDADNTLWDTDLVFREAQLAMLHSLADSGLPVAPDSDLVLLRDLDQELIRYFNVAEYDFSVLCYALAHYYIAKPTIKGAVQAAVSSSPPNAATKRTASRAYKAFMCNMERLPILFDNVEDTLGRLKDLLQHRHALVMILFTEGRQSRIERITQHYSDFLRTIFNEIIIERKSLESFRTVRDLAATYFPQTSCSRPALFVLVGDSIHHDIKLGNRAGFITVYKPSQYKGIEAPKAEDEIPDFSIESLRELFSVLHELGVSADDEMNSQEPLPPTHD